MDDNWIIAMTCTFPHEAHMIKGYLESRGIETFLKDEMTVQVNKCCWWDQNISKRV